MKTLFISLIIVLLASVANAGALATLTSNIPQDENGRTEENPGMQPYVPELQYLPAIVDCGPPTTIAEILARFEELPFLEGETVVKRPDGVIMRAKMTMYLNAETGSYSLVAKFPVNIWCVINSGGNVKPSILKKQT